MTSRKPYKRNKKGGARFVQLSEWFQCSEAWATLPPGPRALYIELKRRYNGSNNGEITLSHREAASALNVHRNSVGPWFRELQERGFIRMVQAPYLGAAGIGKTAIWALEELPTTDRKPAGMAFKGWQEKQNPRTKYVTLRHKYCDTSTEIASQSGATVTNIVTHRAKIGG